MRRGDVLQYLVGDHLGTTSLVLDTGGAKVAESRHYPYGAERWSWVDGGGEFPTDYRFTGQREDGSVNLYAMGARWYDPAVGRWVSPDTLVPGLGNSQNLNRYSYVNNNPLVYNDPTGHFLHIAVGAGIGAVVGVIASAGPQMIQNIRDGQPLIANIDPGQVAKAAAVGAVGGAVGAATFGVGTAVMGTGLAAMMGSGAISGAIAGQASRAAGNVLSGQEVTAGLGNPTDIAADAALGAAGGAIAYGIGQLAHSASTGTSDASGISTDCRLLPSPKLHSHHIFPQKWTSWFAKRGIDSDQYTVALEAKTHLAGLHGKGGFVGPGDAVLAGRWNLRWQEFIALNPNASTKEIYQFAGKLMDEFGLSGLPIVPYSQ